MKNHLAFGALTFAFTVAGAALGYALHAAPEALVSFVFIIALIGSSAAALCKTDNT